MRVVIRADPQLASEFVAKYIRDRILSFKPSLGRPFVLGLPTGSTPIPVYKKLVEFHKVCPTLHVFLDLNLIIFLTHDETVPVHHVSNSNNQHFK